MMYLSIAVVVVLAIQMSSADLVHGMLCFIHKLLFACFRGLLSSDNLCKLFDYKYQDVEPDSLIFHSVNLHTNFIWEGK